MTSAEIHQTLNRAIVFGLCALAILAACGCATIEQTRINADGSSYTAKGKVFLKGNIAELKTTLSEAIDHDGHYTLEIGQDSATLDADAMELVGLLNNLSLIHI